MILIPYVKQTHNCIINIHLNTVPHTEKNLNIQMFHIRVGCGINQALIKPLKPVLPSLQTMRPGIRHFCYPHD